MFHLVEPRTTLLSIKIKDIVKKINVAGIKNKSESMFVGRQTPIAKSITNITSTIAVMVF